MKIPVIVAILFLLTSCISLTAVQKESVSFRSGSITLKGTRYMPKGDGPFPAVVFVHGSGPETRRNSSYSARWMASIGYIALTFDKRGTGESGGAEKDWDQFNFADLADDVVAAVHFLSENNEVDKASIGLHATSQGGWVAPLAASKTDLIQFMVIKSASVCSVGEDRIFERSARLQREGFSVSDMAEAQEMQMVEAKTTPGDNSPDEFTMLFEQNKDKSWFPRVYGGEDPFTSSLIAYRRWYATIVDFNSVPYLQQSDIPVFWIFGDAELDQLGPVEQSVSTLEMLKDNGKPYEITSYEGEGHHVNERKYELALHTWLSRINDYHGFKFRRH